jgi:hypothetical protein
MQPRSLGSQQIQSPLSVALDGEKLATATALVEQLKAGHIEPTHSPWDTHFRLEKSREDGGSYSI